MANSMTASPPIAVITPAYNAAGTIARAVRSALALPEVAEVLVVDDASPDDTVRAAREAANGDPRLRVVIQAENRGPSAARNRAIAETSAPLIAILDADDFFIPGRFAPILATPDWDLCADNIAFVPPEEPFRFAHTAAENAEAITVQFEEFVLRNISTRKRNRGELGFLKPVMRRAFLERHRLKYCESCRLGEDFLLYVEALARGARFKILPHCGYGAVVRQESLSSRHATNDLKALIECEQALLRSVPLDAGQAKALNTHLLSVQRKLVHRQVLDTRKERGLVRGVLSAVQRPSAALDILLDRAVPPPPPVASPKLLLSAADFERFRA